MRCSTVQLYVDNVADPISSDHNIVLSSAKVGWSEIRDGEI